MDYFTNSSTPPYNCTGKNSKIFKYGTKLCRLNNFDPISYTTLLNRKHQNVKQTLKILLLKAESVGPDQEFIQLPFQYLIISLLLSGVHHFLLASPCVDESADDPAWKRERTNILIHRTAHNPCLRVFPPIFSKRQEGNKRRIKYLEMVADFKYLCDNWQTCSVLTKKLSKRNP